MNDKSTSPVPYIDAAAVMHAARTLEQGGLVAFPTETVYGLGGDAENPAAIAAIYAAKGRPANHPVIVHVSPEADIGYWAASVPVEARRLIASFWPGPLTLILKRAAHIPDAVAGGQDSVGLRCPAHPVAQALLREFRGGKGGIAGPSANKFGHVSPTTADHVREEFGSDADSLVDYVLDGGQSEVGIESTIVDLSRVATHGPVLLRPGQISADRIEAVLGVPLATPDATAPRASGTLDAHYAPHTPVVQVEPARLQDVLAQLAAIGKKVALIGAQHHEGKASAAIVRAMPASVDAYAHDLYAALRDMDHTGADLIVVESLPVTPAWQGVNDRLRRAAFDSQGVLERLLNA
ncbi:threonylcarbamoyl-AMP synthase [Herbaspirillum sp. AP02]|uniref:L-threonylcarbamoyladenylate synthase n=1 Tax=unclassified Herbaspirillum TaxID=2624150 RepID=UPI0015DBB052|nr:MULTISPECIES: L-threonylcarbamoyladenylate synthase [unclassified Herbaspirillum]MBG7619206.1 threonylcarbamoyl-AMP synthase [Herbaspirillum sp. AP02]NZD66490.1 threonylcarbamoyl-AMP synthase [Herbaspirillum sp. AP21]